MFYSASAFGTVLILAILFLVVIYSQTPSMYVTATAVFLIVAVLITLNLIIATCAYCFRWIVEYKK